MIRGLDGSSPTKSVWSRFAVWEGRGNCLLEICRWQGVDGSPRPKGTRALDGSVIASVRTWL